MGMVSLDPAAGRLVALTSGGRDVGELLQQLHDKGAIVLHRPGWLNGTQSGWRVEITNVGWKAMDTRPARNRTSEESNEG
jgi:hypothetical protein